jgi:hypothetical protein
MHGNVFIQLLTFVYCLYVSVHLNPPWADLYSRILVLRSMSIRTTPATCAMFAGHEMVARETTRETQYWDFSSYPYNTCLQ